MKEAWAHQHVEEEDSPKEAEKDQPEEENYERSVSGFQEGLVWK